MSFIETREILSDNEIDIACIEDYVKWNYLIISDEKEIREKLPDDYNCTARIVYAKEQALTGYKKKMLEKATEPELECLFIKLDSRLDENSNFDLLIIQFYKNFTQQDEEVFKEASKRFDKNTNMASAECDFESYYSLGPFINHKIYSPEEDYCVREYLNKNIFTKFTDKVLVENPSDISIVGINCQKLYKTVTSQREKILIEGFKRQILDKGEEPSTLKLDCVQQIIHDDKMVDAIVPVQYAHELEFEEDKIGFLKKSYVESISQIVSKIDSTC